MRLGPGWVAYVIGAVAALVSCSPGAPAPLPLFLSAEGAALCAVASRESRERAPAALVNLSLVSRSNDASVRGDLNRCMRVEALTFGETMHGGGSPTDSALRLDLRASEHGTGADSVGFLVSAERCAGWPCHAVYEVVVRRTPEGVRVVSLKPIIIG